jgi:hypothetical protein
VTGLTGMVLASRHNDHFGQRDCTIVATLPLASLVVLPIKNRIKLMASSELWFM